ncbi:hypothetical protein AAFF_G00416140 [Aldrovandia affinis]|uniref:Uncharacterized protein n=1 Tax=Aldrovandia affinis TaxID=143900 RepID=A0AAD7SAV9_9TELE|nr:hypothetical protein AAFF_G00416140 [Aldrovandia affinis]
MVLKVPTVWEFRGESNPRLKRRVYSWHRKVADDSVVLRDVGGSVERTLAVVFQSEETASWPAEGNHLLMEGQVWSSGGFITVTEYAVMGYVARRKYTATHVPPSSMQNSGYL